MGNPFGGSNVSNNRPLTNTQHSPIQTTKNISFKTIINERKIVEVELNQFRNFMMEVSSTIQNAIDAEKEVNTTHQTKNPSGFGCQSDNRALNLEKAQEKELEAYEQLDCLFNSGDILVKCTNNIFKKLARKRERE